MGGGGDGTRRAGGGRRGPPAGVDAAGREPREGKRRSGPWRAGGGHGTGGRPLSGKTAPGAGQRARGCPGPPSRLPRRARGAPEGAADPAQRYRGGGRRPGRERRGDSDPRHSRAGQRLEKWRFFPNAEPRWGLGPGIAKEQAKVQRAAWEGRKEEEERSPQAGAHHRVNAAFHCRTREDISVEQRTRQELQLFYIVSAQPAPLPWLRGHPPRHRGSFSNSSHSLSQPDREEMFHRGLGLNLTSGQYTAPIAGYYTFTTTLHIGEPSGSPTALAGWSGMALTPGSVPVHREPPKKRQVCRGTRLSVLICVQSRCQHNRNLETSSWLESRGDLFTISVTGVLYLQVSGVSTTGDGTGQEGAFCGPSSGLGIRSASPSPKDTQGRALLLHCSTDHGWTALKPCDVLLPEGRVWAPPPLSCCAQGRDLSLALSGRAWCPREVSQPC
ncbi:uncharacterized protein LOC127468248 isoform X3 [Manacus candei]|uniref:uncharacterized protein LOC127468248 isoform X3 n=1 Tax=Manacus candei TaxID=415023 RepID=UPI00222642F6|nr:uncharacterized protein LOC127468248 isoform X3 [Manacus candei]